MNHQVQPTLGAIWRPARPDPDHLLGWIGRLFSIATLIGLGIFGAYTALRAAGATSKISGSGRSWCQAFRCPRYWTGSPTSALGCTS